MSRGFDAASSEYLQVTSSLITSEPFTMGCWFNTSNAADAQGLMGITDISSASMWHLLQASGNVASDPIRAQSFDGGGSSSAATSTGYSINTWHHACAVFTSSASRAAYIDGGSKGTNTGSETVTGLDTIATGRRSSSTPSNYITGNIAEAAIWDVALTDEEVASLAACVSPLLIRPQSLVFYAPLVRDEDRDIVSGLSLTAGGTPTVEDHVRIISPYNARISYAAAAPPAGRIMGSLAGQGGLAGAGGLAGPHGGMAG